VHYLGTSALGSAFTIAGIEDTGVEDLLVISAGSMNGVEPNGTVQVTGTVHQSFELATVEEELNIDLDDSLYEQWDAKPYIEASSVDTSVNAEQ